MTDKQLIETLKNIKRYCYIRLCKDCRFDINNHCQIYEISKELGSPIRWDIEKLERIIKQ